MLAKKTLIGSMIFEDNSDTLLIPFQLASEYAGRIGGQRSDYHKKVDRVLPR